MPSAGNQEAIELHEVSRRRQCLAGGIVECLVACRVDSKDIKCVDTGEVECPLSHYGDLMDLVGNAAGPYRFERQPKTDFRQRAFAFKASV